MIPAAKAVYAANPDILIFFSGLDSDTNVSPLVSAQDLGAGYRFDVENFPFADKVVLELHDYSWDQLIPDCVAYDAALNSDGFYVLNMSAPDVQNRLPVIMTEFGFAPETYTSLYAQCLKQFLVSEHIGWTMWDISGSYYTRQGIQDYDEQWGKPAESAHVSSKLNIIFRSSREGLVRLEERGSNPELLSATDSGVTKWKRALCGQYASFPSCPSYQAF